MYSYEIDFNVKGVDGEIIETRHMIVIVLIDTIEAISRELERRVVENHPDIEFTIDILRKVRI